MTQQVPGRPGRKLQPNPDDPRPAGVVELARRLIELIVRADTGWREMADGVHRQTKQNLWYQVQTRRNGPDKHVVEQIVDFCCDRLDEPSGPLKSEFLRLWEIANRDFPDPMVADGGQGGTDEAPSLPLVAPDLVSPVLQLVYLGERHEAAQRLIAQYPLGGTELGLILAAVGSRTAAGVVDLLDAVVEEAGTALADTYLEALRSQDVAVAAAVEAVPRTRPVPVPAPAAAEPDRPQSVLDEDPRKGDGRRRAALIRRGEVAQVSAEIINEAAAQGTATRKYFNPGPNPSLAGDLIFNVLQHDGDDREVLAILLGQLITDGQVGLVTEFLGRLHGIPENGDDVIQTVLKGMKRPALRVALDHLAADKRNPNASKQLRKLILAQAPAPVTGAHLLEWELSRHPGTIEMSGLPHLQTVLRSMIEHDPRATAQVLISQMETWNVETAFSAPATHPESLTAAAVLDLIRTDTTSAGQLFYALIATSTENASQLLFLLEAPRGGDDTIATAAQILTAAIRHDPGLTPGLIARMVRHHDVPARVLERVARTDEDHARRLARAMLVEDLPYFRSVLSTLLRQDALVLAGELLRQLDDQEPDGPWKLINHALKDGVTNAALANLDAYAPDQSLPEDRN